MRKQYNELFDKISPRMSDEELLRAVLDRKAENMSDKKHFGKKAIIIPSVAAAALLCTTVGVSAAYEWNLSAAIADIFGRTSEDIPDGVSFKDFNFTTVGGRELDDVLKFDGYEVRMRGVAADPHSMLLFYDVEFEREVPEETAESFRAMHTITDLGLFVDYNRVLGAAGTADDPVFSKKYSWKHIHMAQNEQVLYLGCEGNVAHYCLRESVNGASLAGRSVALELGSASIDENNVVTYGNNDAITQHTVDLGFVDDGNSLDIYKDHDITLSSGVKGVVSHIQVTPFSVCFRVDWGEQIVEEPDENGGISAGALNVNTIHNECKIKLKDGTIMDSKAFRPFEDETKRKYSTEDFDGKTIYAQDPVFEWLYPVNVSEVEALIIGETTVPVN